MKILFYVDSVFPYGAAWSSRARYFSKLFKSLGYDIHVISTYSFEENYIPNEIKKFDGYTYQTLRKEVGKFDRILNPHIALRQIEEYVEENEVDIFFSTRCPDIYNKLYKFFKRRRIPFYIEQCEWFEKSTFKLGGFDPYYRKLNYQIQHKLKKSNGIVAISSLLENHYKNQGAKVIRIPTILDIDNTDYSINVSDDGILRIVFAGNIDGQKELMYPIFKAIDMLGDLSSKLEFNVLGPSEEKILENIDNDTELLSRIKGSIKIHGRVQQQNVEKYLKNSDFMIFIRPVRRSSNAGFPTKFAESLAVGTPVITNITSDIGRYLRDGENGYILNDITPEEVLKVLKKIYSLSKSEREKIRNNARITAEKNFNYKNYSNTVKDFFSDSSVSRKDMDS